MVLARLVELVGRCTGYALMTLWGGLQRRCAMFCSEEDFKAAVRIRDHPWMVLYQRIQQARAAQYDEVQLLRSV